MRSLIRRLRHRVRAHRVRRWARTRLRRGDAVILDTETTDLYGHVIQVSVIDLHGRTLMSDLVRPPTGITPASTVVHGLTDGDVAAAPPFAQIAPALLSVTAGRHLLAYNAPYDRDVLIAGFAAAGLDPAHLADPRNWTCLMRARATVQGGPWVKLGGPHHALGDCLATLEVLHQLAGDPT